MRIVKLKQGQEVFLEEKPTHELVCCDCGLKHGFCFKIVKSGIRLRMWREKSSKAARAMHILDDAVADQNEGSES